MKKIKSYSSYYELKSDFADSSNSASKKLDDIELIEFINAIRESISQNKVQRAGKIR